MEEERKRTSWESQACVGPFKSEFGFDLEYPSKPQKGLSVIDERMPCGMLPCYHTNASYQQVPGQRFRGVERKVRIKNRKFNLSKLLPLKIVDTLKSSRVFRF